MKFLQNIKDGFTLAEVLITLVIIGVIASMTIPTLINKTNKQDTISRLKKAYSTMAQATNRILADEGDPRADIGGWATSSSAVYNLYKKHLSNAKDCPGETAGCFTGPYKGYNSSINFDTTRNTLVLADGTEIVFWDLSQDCSIFGQGSRDICTLIYADVNGAKGPNTFGRDTFSFVLKENGLYPAGCDYDECSTAVDLGCTCRALREGAINY